MPNPNLTELVLSCGSWQEAQAIADSLLEKKLIASAEFLDQQEREGVKLIMQSATHLFENIEAEIAKLQPKSFALQQIPLTHESKAAKLWLEEITNG